MKIGKAYTLKFRRKREGRTDYRSRLSLLVAGKLRVVLRKGINNFTVQMIKFEAKGDKVVVSASSRELLKYGWKAHRGNLSSAYLTAFLCGLKAKKQGVKSGVVDLGLFSIVKGSSFFSAIKGLVDSGFDVPVGVNAFPKEERIKGKHIVDYASKLKGKKEYDKQFSNYLKLGLKPEDLMKHFEEVKSKILDKWK